MLCTQQAYQLITKLWTKSIMNRQFKFPFFFLGFFIVSLVPAMADLNTDSSDSKPNDQLEKIVTDATPGNKTDKNVPKVTLVVRINVPHNTNTFDSCRVYPYPVAPPAIKKPINHVPVAEKSLREILATMGYILITNTEKPYPPGGWRMQYIMKAAVARSGIAYPHTAFTLYPWVDNILPYVVREVVASNAKEKSAEHVMI